MLIRSFGQSVALAVLCLGAIGGCTGGVPKGTVTGSVTHQGKPVPEGCLVTFISDVGFAALGTVDKQGNYKLVMAGDEKIPAAKYNVSVTFPGIQGPEMSEEEERKFMGGDPEMQKKFGNLKQPKSPFPDKFSDPILSGLTFEIQTGVNKYDIKMP